MGGLLHLVQRGGDWAGPQPAQAPPRQARSQKCDESGGAAGGALKARESRRRRRRGSSSPKATRGVGVGRRCPLPMGRVLGKGCAPSPYFFNFLSRYAAFWVQYYAFSDITRPVPNSLHSQPAESSDIIKPASATLRMQDAGCKGCRAF